ncbi:MAG: hypothetical protein ACF8XB_15020 [Planctomycetota bacterium JB042]
MSPSRPRPLASALLLAVVATGCTVVDVRNDSRRVGVRSDGLIDGFATVGWAKDPSFLRAELFDGRSDGALALVDLWYLARVELGLAGASVGVGPFDVGVGSLFYEPRSPAGTAVDDRGRDDDFDCDCEPIEALEPLEPLAPPGD